LCGGEDGERVSEKRGMEGGREKEGGKNTRRGVESFEMK
jgi:hypothetical protein